MNRSLINLRRPILQHFKVRLQSGTKQDIADAPIKFSSSPAAQRKPLRPVVQTIQVVPWYQMYSVIGSIAVFLVYFCILREENDIDVEFTQTLYSRISGLEKEQLLQAYKHNKEQGLSCLEIETRLQEIAKEEKMISS